MGRVARLEGGGVEEEVVTRLVLDYGELRNMIFDYLDDLDRGDSTSESMYKLRTWRRNWEFRECRGNNDRVEFHNGVQPNEGDCCTP